MPVIPVTQEAEAQESLELGRQRLQWAKTVPLHSSLSDRERLCQKKKKKPQKPGNKFKHTGKRLMYTENYKTLLKETKEDLIKWKDIPCSWTEDLILLKYFKND